MSGTVKRVAVRIALEGADPVRTQLTAVGAAGEQAMQRVQRGTQSAALSTGNFRSAIGQAGFQLQDFVVQVQGGTSALTALGQQGSQLLGIFGPTGAIAGAVLAVGTLAAQFLLLGNNAEQELKRTEANFRGLAQVGQDVARVLREINELFLTAGERGAAAANAQRRTLVEDTRRLLDVTVQRNEANVIELAQARRDLAQAEEGIRRRQEETRARTGSRISDADRDNERRLFEPRARVAGIEADIARQSARIGELREALARAENAGRVGAEEFGPAAPDRARRGGGGGGVARRVATGPTDDQVLSRFRSAFGQVDQQQRLLQQYEEQQRAFTEALDRGVISEEDFGRAVEQSSLRLGEQLQALEQRNTLSDRGAQSAKDFAQASVAAGRALAGAFEDLVFEGRNFNEVLRDLERNLLRLGNKFFLEPLFAGLANSLFGGFGGGGGQLGNAGGGGFGGLIGRGIEALIGALGFADGAAFAGGRITPFARGGIVARPTLFPMADGMGLMGEAGPEAVMPLRRDRNGRLGVMASGGSVTININGVTDAASFRQSQAQIGADIARAVRRGQRSL